MRPKKQGMTFFVLSEMNVTLGQEIHIEDVIEDALECASIHRTLRSAKLYALQTVREAIEEVNDALTKYGQPEALQRKPSLSWVTTESMMIWDAKWDGMRETDDWQFRIREVSVHDLK